MPTSDYRTPLDIANRGLQHTGASRITSFDFDNKTASEVEFAYDKLRRAELRRNVWRFAIRKAVLRAIGEDTLELVVPGYEAAKTYIPGSLVTSLNVTYLATQAVPLNKTPGEYPELWTQYFGPDVAAPWDNTLAYFAGELVYTPVDDTADVYLSMENSNEDDPTQVPAYDATIVYRAGETVTYLSVVYQSTTDLNIGNTPTGASPWIVVPATQPVQMQGRKWIRLNVGLRAINVVYPLGTGPRSQTTTRNIYRLPHGYLRQAPQDPKAGSTSVLGAPTGSSYDDWDFEGNYIVSTTTPLIIFRFVADIADVTQMDPMFCEGLAARIGLELCEVLTQSSDKLANIGQQYNRFMTEARIVNGIETGPTEPPEDDYIACRV